MDYRVDFLQSKGGHTQLKWRPWKYLHNASVGVCILPVTEKKLANSPERVCILRVILVLQGKIKIEYVFYLWYLKPGIIPDTTICQVPVHTGYHTYQVPFWAYVSPLDAAALIAKLHDLSTLLLLY